MTKKLTAMMAALKDGSVVVLASVARCGGTQRLCRRFVRSGRRTRLSWVKRIETGQIARKVRIRHEDATLEDLLASFEEGVPCGQVLTVEEVR